MKNPTRVVHLMKEEYDLLGARPSSLGNLYKVGPRYTRGQAIALHRKFLLHNNPGLLEYLKGYQGKRIGCYCDPLPCHCHTYAQILDELEPGLCPFCREQCPIVIKSPPRRTPARRSRNQGKDDVYWCRRCLLTHPTEWSHLGRLMLDAMKIVKRKKRRS